MRIAGTRRFRRGRKTFLFVFLFLFSFLILLPCCAAASGESAQRDAALEICLALSRAADAAEKEKLYLRLIEECPETEDAEEAYWALSNLYLDGFDEPKEDEARKVLEQFLARYPSSLWAPHVKSRLLWLRGEEEII
jgi:outer membrane protein assembly factor BamD (BamD/ComL family)